MASKKYKVTENNLNVYSQTVDPDYGLRQLYTLDKGTTITVEEIVKGKDRDIAKMPDGEFCYSRYHTHEYLTPAKAAKKKEVKE